MLIYSISKYKLSLFMKFKKWMTNPVRGPWLFINQFVLFLKTSTEDELFKLNISSLEHMKTIWYYGLDRPSFSSEWMCDHEFIHLFTCCP